MGVNGYGKITRKKVKYPRPGTPPAITVRDIEAAAERGRRRDEERLAVAMYLPRHDCDFPGCQLSAGHPPPHCVEDLLRSGRYLIIDDNGKVLREV
jgi:hypothetical protein